MIDEVMCSEDRLFDDKLINLIESFHAVSVDRDSIRRRIYWNGYEIDVMFIAYTRGKGVPRLFIIELKENDISRVLLQASKRSCLAHYTYAVINHQHWYIVDFIIRHWKALIPLIASSGIGIISYNKPCIGNTNTEPILIRPAKFNKPKIKTLTEYIKTGVIQ